MYDGDCPHASDHMLQIIHVSQCLPVAGVRGDGVMSSLCCTPLLSGKPLIGPSSCLTAAAATAAVEQENHIITAVSWSH